MDKIRKSIFGRSHWIKTMGCLKIKDNIILWLLGSRHHSFPLHEAFHRHQRPGCCNKATAFVSFSRADSRRPTRRFYCRCWRCCRHRRCRVIPGRGKSAAAEGNLKWSFVAAAPPIDTEIDAEGIEPFYYCSRRRRGPLRPCGPCGWRSCRTCRSRSSSSSAGCSRCCGSSCLWRRNPIRRSGNCGRDPVSGKKWNLVNIRGTLFRHFANLERAGKRLLKKYTFPLKLWKKTKNNPALLCRTFLEIQHLLPWGEEVTAMMMAAAVSFPHSFHLKWKALKENKYCAAKHTYFVRERTVGISASAKVGFKLTEFVSFPRFLLPAARSAGLQLIGTTC